MCMRMYVRACIRARVAVDFLLMEWMLSDLVFNLWGLFIFGGLVYILGALMVWGFLLLGFYIVFLILCCFDVFFDFLGVLIFGFFDDFLMFFWFFYDFFFWLLLCFYSPKWVQFLKFSCNSFFLEYTDAALMRWHAKRHRPEFCGFGSGI